MSFFRVPWLWRTAAAVVLTMSCSGAALAQSAAVERGKSGEAELRQPTPAELRKLADQLNLSEEVKDLKSTPLAGGGEAINLKGRFENVTLAVRTADGSVATTCVSNKADAKKFLKSKAGKGRKNQHTAQAQAEVQ